MKIDDKMKRIILIAVPIVLIILLVVFLIIKNSNKTNGTEILLKQFEEIGIDFYENFYYAQVGSTQEEIDLFLSDYTTIGIKISLDNLTRYETEQNAEVIEKLIEKCNPKETKVIVYPHAPYEKNSYTTEVVTACDFEQ